MNDILFRNNNNRPINRIMRRELVAEKRRNIFIIIAISLTTFMLASVFSIGISYYDSIKIHEKRMQGSISQIAFSHPTEEQLSKIHTLDYVKTIGIGASVGQASNIGELGEIPLSYVDKTQWNDMFCPTFTNIEGHFPKDRNEIMLSRYILDALGIKGAKIGMKIPITITVNGSSKPIKINFILSCIYTEYIHSRPGGDLEIYCSSELADEYGALANENLTVNVIFTNNNTVNKNMKKLKNDLSFSEEQQYIQSSVSDTNFGSITTYLTFGGLIIFFMLAGYLLIYNVMYIAVSKNVQFFGMLKTVGTTPKQIRSIVIRQVMYLCLIALPIGCISAAVVSMLIVPSILNNSGIDKVAAVSFSPVIYIGAGLFALLTAFLGALTPAKRAANISPIEALHYTGEYSEKFKANFPVSGKPTRMAFRNVFREKKRAIIVILSLFLSITVFSSVMIVVNSIDIDNYVNSEYDYDFFFTSGKTNSYFLDKDVTDQLNKENGINDTATTNISSIELIYTDELSQYADWETKDKELPRDSIITNGTFYNTHTIKGIDMFEFNEINSSLSKHLDAESFERGEYAIINTTNKNLMDSLKQVSKVSIRRNADDDAITIPIDHVVCLPSEQSDTVFQYSDIEIIVSNSFLKEYISDLQLFSFGMNVKSEYEEQLYNELKEFASKNEINMISRYGGRLAMQDTKIIMLVLGGGISFILGLIGILNFINVMSVGVMARKREFAILESVGMSKKQLRLMLRFEGLEYVIITLISSLIIGNIIGYGIFILFKNIAEYAIFSYPIIPILIEYVVILIICCITPEIAYHSISQETLIERLRQAE